MEIMTYSLLLIKETGKGRGNVCCDVRKKKIGRFYSVLLERIMGVHCWIVK